MAIATTGFLDSDSIIATVKREALVPTNQNLFQDVDFLAMANQEMRISMVPQIISMHEEYFTRDSDPIALVANQSNYAIPYRAVGNKFRDVYYLDTNNNLRSLSRISPDDRPYYQLSNFQNRFVYFFIQGNDIVICPNVGTNPQGSLVFTFYMRPNELVTTDRVSTITAITDYGTTESTITGTTTNLSTTLSALSSVTNIAVGQLVSGTGIPSNTFVSSVGVSSCVISNAATASGTGVTLEFENVTAFTVDTIPSTITAIQAGVTLTSFTTSTLMDMCQTQPGHKVLSFDKTPVKVDTTNKIIYFISEDVSSQLVVGDYLSYASECIVPNIPSDMHDLLCQRVVTRVMLALGDQAGYQAAQSKLADMVNNAGTLISNRSEGEPQKITALNSVLRGAKIRRRGWY